jgi:hypothetical protein
MSCDRRPLRSASTGSAPATSTIFVRLDAPATKRIGASFAAFFIGCRDASGEFLAEDLTAEITSDSYESVLQEAVNRTCGLSQGATGVLLCLLTGG